MAQTAISFKVMSTVNLVIVCLYRRVMGILGTWYNLSTDACRVSVSLAAHMRS